MIPTVIILSLEDAVARRAPLIAEFEARGIPYEIWPAIDGRKGLPPEYETMIDRDKARQNLKREMGNAEFACALSHHFIYRDILARDLDMAVVLEDDAIVDDRFFDFLKVVQKLDCDLLLLYHLGALVRENNPLRLVEMADAFRLISTPIMANAYIVTQNGAKKLVERSLPISRPADWPINLAKLNAFAVSPRLVGHPPHETAPSDIRAERNRHYKSVSRRRRPSAVRFLRIVYWEKKYYKYIGKRIS